MKPPNFDKFFFRLNILVAIVVFVLIIPTTRIFASWYPRDKKVLWLIPVCMMSVSVVSWLILSSVTPWLFKKGFFEERRHDDGSARYQGLTRFKKRLIPMLNLMASIFLITLFCYFMIMVMQGDLLSSFLFFKAGE